MIEMLKAVLEELSPLYGCTVTYNILNPNAILLSECHAGSSDYKWEMLFSFEENRLNIESYGLMYSDYSLKGFPITTIKKDEVDLGGHFEVEGLPDLKRTEISFLSDKTIEVIKLVVEKDGEGMHVELIESRDSKDFSVLLSNYFNCDIAEIDDDGYQHYLVQRVDGKWLGSSPEIGSWTQETLYNALIIDYSYGEQLIHFTFYNKDAHLVQQSNVFIRSIEKIENGLLFNSVKRNKSVELVMDERVAICVKY